MKKTFFCLIFVMFFFVQCSKKPNQATEQEKNFSLSLEQKNVSHTKNVPHEFLDAKKSISFSKAFRSKPSTLLTFRDLRRYNPKKSKKMPKLLNALEGKKVVVNGFVIPVGPPDMSYFILTKVPFNECYFCLPPAENEQIVVYQDGLADFDMMEGPIRVTGKLDAGEQADVNGFTTLYRMNAMKIEQIEEEVLPKDTKEELAVIRKKTAAVMALQKELLKKR